MPNFEFTICSAVYNKEKFLSTYLKSLEKQTYNIDNIEIILVDDGSTDNSLEICKAFASKHKSVSVLSKTNGGQASARNLGIKQATGKWITFIDPDDEIDLKYFSEISNFLKLHIDNEISLISPKTIKTEMLSGKIIKNPLDSLWKKSKIISLDNDKSITPAMGSNTQLFLLGVIKERGIFQSEEVKPKYEDGHFVAKYLLEFDCPILSTISDAKYYYNVYPESAIQSSKDDPRMFIDLFDYGYIDILKYAKQKKNLVPLWLQNQIIYEMFWLFKQTRSHRDKSYKLFDNISFSNDFQKRIKQVFSFISYEAIIKFSTLNVPYDIYYLMLSLSGNQPNPKLILLNDKHLFHYCYYFIPDESCNSPYEDFRSNIVIDSKITKIIFFGKPYLARKDLYTAKMLTQDIIIENQPPLFEIDRNLNALFSANPLRYKKRVKKLKNSQFRQLSKFKQKFNIIIIRYAKILAKLSKKYRDTWVITDRVYNSSDNGEYLYRFIKKKHKNVKNVYFVINKNCEEYSRLKKEGISPIKYNSFKWKLIMLNCKNNISSHIDPEVAFPKAIKEFGFVLSPWNQIFLQHGVIKDNISRWLNPKRIDTFITSTQPEYDYITQEKSEWSYTKQEIKLTGLPRFDKLGLIKNTQKDILLFTPTWREWFNSPAVDQKTYKRDISDSFWGSDWFVNWNKLLNDKRLFEYAKKENLEIVFMPHNNLYDAMVNFKIPEYIKLEKFEGSKIQPLFARTKIFYTDYSSSVFDLAFINTPVIYFQYEPSDANYIPGYFEYGRDGFGPVCKTVDEVLNASKDIFNNGLKQRYIDNQKVFDNIRDGKCCERVYNEILKL
jgi:glycosyltransferase involved in cell wall biosynthesis